MSEQFSPPIAQLEPANDLEKILAAAQDGQITTAEFLRHLIDSDVYLLLSRSEEPDAEGERDIHPLVLEGPDKAPMLAVFTLAERTSPLTEEFPDFTFPLEVEFSWVVANGSDGMGLVINPGWSYAASLPPEALTQLRNKPKQT